MTVIYVTHYPEEILPIFDRCLVLRQGKMVDMGMTNKIMTTKQLSKDLEAEVFMQYTVDGRMDLRVK